MGIDLGNRPPYLRSIKALPIDMNEGWAVDVEIEYSGHFLIEIETRLDVRESEMQSSIVSRSNELGLGGDDTSDIIKESLNDYNQQFNSSSDSEGVDGPDDENKLGKHMLYLSTFLFNSCMNGVVIGFFINVGS